MVSQHPRKAFRSVTKDFVSREFSGMAKTEQHKDKGVIASFSALLRSKDNINIRNVRLKNLKYMLIFPLAPVFANMQGALFSDSARLFGLDAMTLMGSAYCIGAGALFALTNQKNMARISRVSAIATASAFIPWLMMAEGQLSLILALLFMFGLGGCAACAAFAYTFALNNAERFLGAAAISFFFALNQIAPGLSFLPGIWNRAYLTALVAGSCICLIRYKASDFSAPERKPEATLNSALKLMLYFFVAHYFVEIFYTYLPGSSSADAMLANGTVGVFVVCLAAALQLITKRSVWNMCNLFLLPRSALISSISYRNPLCEAPPGSFTALSRWDISRPIIFWAASLKSMETLVFSSGVWSSFCRPACLPISFRACLLPMRPRCCRWRRR
jgi:hypothetical protein